MLRRAITIAVIATFAVLLPAAASFATIHPIVESFDCANDQAFANHPLGDPADPPGQTPGYGSHSDQSTLRAINQAAESAFAGKSNGVCGGGG